MSNFHLYTKHREDSQRKILDDSYCFAATCYFSAKLKGQTLDQGCQILSMWQLFKDQVDLKVFLISHD